VLNRLIGIPRIKFDHHVIAAPKNSFLSSTKLRAARRATAGSIQQSFELTSRGSGWFSLLRENIAEREATQAVERLEGVKTHISNQLDISWASQANVRNRRVIITS